MRKKRNNTPDLEDFELQVSPTIFFCTECGKDLEDFDLNDKSKDKEAIKQNFKNCLESGKFKGDMCSKLFIIKEDESNGIAP